MKFFIVNFNVFLPCFSDASGLSPFLIDFVLKLLIHQTLVRLHNNKYLFIWEDNW